MKSIFYELINKYEVTLNSNDIYSIDSRAVAFLVSIEDRRYYRHIGVDFLGVFRALYNYVFKNKLEGASTIEQQLVRTLTGKYEVSIKRKVLEIILSIYLSRKKSKDEIAKVYLSIAYYGWRMIGYKQAIKKISLTPESPNDYEIASLVARLRYPESRESSTRKKEKIHARAEYALLKANLSLAKKE